MKKILAIVLSIVMLLCCVPFTAFAAGEAVAIPADGIFNTSGKFDSKSLLVSGEVYSVSAGVILEVPEGVTLYIPADASFTVEEGARLDVNGSIVVLDGAELLIKGIINGADSVVTNVNGKAKAEVRFAPLANIGGLLDESGKPKIKVSYAVSSSGNIYEDLDLPEEAYKPVPSYGDKFMVDLNQYIFIRAQIVEPDDLFDKYDDSLMNVYLNGVGVPYKQGSHQTLVTTSYNVTYSPWVNDDYYLNTFNIYLPTGEGYTVYGREGEQSASGETVKLKYGQSFSFRVEIDPEYDMSSYEVYVYNGYGWTDLDTSTLLKDIAPAVPDEYGYYRIDEIKGEHTIFVVGVVKNETLLMVGDILDMVRNVFEMIAEFFKQLVEFLGLDLGGSAEGGATA